jgi:NAD(P)-dependent dehydrogenase (short-subunit alcohol dehydrogenase family)
MAGKLAGKIAVVTGGSAGIGFAAARRFTEEGAHVFITGRRQRELDAAAKAIGPNVTAVKADAASTADIEGLMEAVKSIKGRIDVLSTNSRRSAPSRKRLTTRSSTSM